MLETAFRAVRDRQPLPSLAEERAIGDLYVEGRDRIVTVYGPDRGDRVEVNLSVPPEARFAMIAAVAAMDGGHPEAALSHLAGVARLASGRDATWHYLVGAAYTMLRRHESARDAFLESLKVQRDSFAVKMCLAYSHMLLKEWPKARRTLKSLAALARGNRKQLAQVWYARGLVQLQTRTPDSGAAAFARSIELNPRDPRPYHSLAFLYAKQASGITAPEVDRAIELYRKLTAERPDLAWPFVELGALLDRRRDVEGALAAFQRALEIDPRNGDAILRMGDAYFRGDRTEEGIRTFEALAERLPRDVLVLDTLGALYGKAGRHSDAERVLRRAIELGSPFGVTRANLGASLFALGLHPEALEQTIAAVELEPDLNWPRHNLSEIVVALLGRAEIPESEPGSAEAGQGLGLNAALWDKVRHAVRLAAPPRRAPAPPDAESEENRSIPARSANAQRFAKSMRWLEEHRGDFAGEWVALDGDRLLSHGKDPETVFAEARSAGVPVPFVERVMPVERLPFGGW